MGIGYLILLKKTLKKCYTIIIEVCTLKIYVGLTIDYGSQCALAHKNLVLIVFYLEVTVTA